MEQQTLERWLPPSIVATRGAMADSEWRYGEERRFDDTVWLVGKPNPYLIDGGVSELRFDSLVDVGGTRLDDPRLRSFQLTKRLTCLELCMQGMGTVSGSRSGIVVYVRIPMMSPRHSGPMSPTVPILSRPVFRDDVAQP